MSGLVHPTGFAYGKTKTISELVWLGCWMVQVAISAPVPDWPGGRRRGKMRKEAATSILYLCEEGGGVSRYNLHARAPLQVFPLSRPGCQKVEAVKGVS